MWFCHRELDDEMQQRQYNLENDFVAAFLSVFKLYSQPRENYAGCFGQHRNSFKYRRDIC